MLHSITNLSLIKNDQVWEYKMFFICSIQLIIIAMYGTLFPKRPTIWWKFINHLVVQFQCFVLVSVYNWMYSFGLVLLVFIIEMLLNFWRTTKRYGLVANHLTQKLYDMLWSSKYKSEESWIARSETMNYVGYIRSFSINASHLMKIAEVEILLFISSLRFSMRFTILLRRACTKCNIF